MRGGRKEANRAELIFNLKIVFEKLETFNPIFCQTLVRRVTESDSLKQAEKRINKNSRDALGRNRAENCPIFRMSPFSTRQDVENLTTDVQSIFLFK